MAEKFHVGPNGPGICRVDPANPNSKGCPFDPESTGANHFDTAKEADQAFEKTMGGAVSEPATRKKPIRKKRLSYDLGEIEVLDGDLDDPMARFAFSNGLCGDLANAIYKLDPERKVYFAFETRPGQHHDLDYYSELARTDPDWLVEQACHVLVESKSSPGGYLDSYGVQSADSVRGCWGVVLEVPKKAFSRFRSESRQDLSKFAQAAIQMDNDSVSHDYAEMNDIYDGEY